MKQPLISIVIPVYNGSNYVKEAIDSALSQTYSNYEIIVVNDGSNDNGKTRRIALSYGDKIRYYEKKNGGVSSALNFALSKMKGEYFSWLSHDDKYLPEKLEKQIDYLIQKNLEGKKIILYSDYNLIDRKSKLVSNCIKDTYMLNEKPEYALLRGAINGITMLIPKKAFEDYGGFDENLVAVQDYELWHKMFKTYKPVHIPFILAETRYHAKQVSNTSPKVISEGNPFWIMMIESVSKAKKIKLEGSVYNYYESMAEFLKDTPYNEAYRHCIENCINERSKVIKKDISVKVSVIIPFYNRIEETIRAIKSVLNQTYNNYEIILVNDGSTEKLSKINYYEKKYEKIKIINLKKNKGAANARNQGIKVSSGDFIAFLDSDDEFEKEKLEEQLYEMILRNGNVSHTSYTRVSDIDKKVIESGKEKGFISRKLMYSCQIATPTVMIRKDFLIKNGFLFDDSLVIGEDVCFWLSMLKNEYLIGIEKPLSIVHTTNKSSAYDNQKQLIGCKTILKYLLNDEYYSKFDIEISNMARSYIYYVNLTNDILNNDIFAEKSYFSRLKNSLRMDGIFATTKKIFRKVFNKVFRR